MSADSCYLLQLEILFVENTVQPAHQDLALEVDIDINKTYCSISRPIDSMSRAIWPVTSTDTGQLGVGLIRCDA